MNNLMLSESEKNRILNLHQNHLIVESIVITDWLSPDEKYCIFLDDLYDINNKVKIGNVFENFDHFIFFLRHCYEKAEYLSEGLRKNLLESVNTFIITESNQDMSLIKPYIKNIIQEWTGNPFDKEFYTGKNWSDAWEGGKEKIKSGWEGLKKANSNIKDGQWAEAFKIIGKGVLYLTRKLRDLLYNPIGLVLDAILLATGIGKVAQSIIWGIVVLLDIYEFVTGDFEDKNMAMGWRLFFFGTDILGLVTAGIAAKTAKSVATKLMGSFGKSEKGLQTALKNSPEMTKAAEQMLKSTSGASSTMQKVALHLQKNSPKIYSFFKVAFNGLNRFLKILIKTLSSVLNLPGKAVEKILPTSLKGTKKLSGISAAANVIVPQAAFHTFGAIYNEREYNKLAMALKNSTVVPEYDITQI